jgi:monoamine oxidase
MDDYDIVILGAGAAGLAAAHTLAASTHTVAIIEARDRMGGRIQTTYPAGIDLPVELGAEFIHGKPPETWHYLRAAHIPLVEMNGVAWRTDAVGFTPAPPESDALRALHQAINTWQGEDCSLRALFDQHFADPAWAAARAQVISYVEDYLAADPAQVSVAWLAEVDQAISSVQGNRSFRSLAGYQPMLEWLGKRPDAKRAVLHLHTIAQHLHWSPHHVEIAAIQPDHRPITLRARAAIITLPLSILALPAGELGAVQFSPDLPAKWAMLEKLGMGHAIKVVFRFQEAFWDTLPPAADTLAQLGFLAADDPLPPSWWTSFPLVTPLLTGWMSGPRAQQLATHSDEAIIDQMLDALAQAWHRSRNDIEARLATWHFHNWSRDPFARGAYSYVRVGGTVAAEALRTPVDDTLFFAGEALNTGGYTSTVHAAFRSGMRAARELLASLRVGKWTP